MSFEVFRVSIPTTQQESTADVRPKKLTNHNRRNPRNKKPPERTASVDILKGQVITEARNADATLDLEVRKRLSMWPEGNEILALLLLLKSDQMCASYTHSAVTTCDPDTSEEIVKVIQDSTFTKREKIVKF